MSTAQTDDEGRFDRLRPTSTHLFRLGECHVMLGIVVNQLPRNRFGGLDHRITELLDRIL
jgi:hypothetical protein